MKQVILNIPDVNYDFFMELMKKLDFISIESENEEIPEDVKRKVIERARTFDRGKALTWEEAKLRLKLK